MAQEDGIPIDTEWRAGHRWEGVKGLGEKRKKEGGGENSHLVAQTGLALAAGRALVEGGEAKEESDDLEYDLEHFCSVVLIKLMQVGVQEELAKCLLCRHEDLSLTPGTQVRKSAVLTCACNPSMKEAETVDPPVLRPASLTHVAHSRSVIHVVSRNKVNTRW